MKNRISCYLLKLHCATQYENAAFLVKQYSHALYNLFNTFAKEDRKHAELIYEDNVSSREDESVNHYNNVVIPLTFIDSEKEDQEAITIDALDSFIWMEKEIHTQMVVHELHGFAQITEFRINMIE